MTMTDSAPATAPATSAASPQVAGLADALTTTDHKRIGRIWLVASLVLLMAATVVGVVVGIERADSGAVDLFGGDNNLFQWWSLGRFGLALLVAAPLFVGLATVVVPMQVGATNIAFPRAALAAAWGYLIGAGITIVSVAAGGGWGALDGVSGEEADAIALTLLGTGMVLGSILLASICIATTVVSLRTAGMTLLRTPLFAWSMLVTAGVWLLTLPIAIANIAIIYVDLRGGPLLFGNPQGTFDVYAQLAWLIEQPQIYAFAIPVLGVLGSVVPVAAGRRHAQHVIAATLIGLFGLLAVGGWSQPYFHDNTEQFVFITFGLVAVIPVLGSIGGSADTLVRGRPPAGLPPAHLMGALGASVLLLFATLGGAARVIQPWELGGTATVTGVMNLTLFASITAAVAGIWFWAVKLEGRPLSAGLGRLAIVDLVLGALLLGAADVVSGFFDADVLQLAVPDDEIVEVLDVVAVVGGVLVALGALGVLAAVARSMLGSAGEADADPWSGHTLEWATTSPPPPGNFPEPPAKVVSEAPLLDAAAGDDTAVTDDIAGDDEEGDAG